VNAAASPLSPPRLAFAVLCALGFLAIAYGAALEISRQKRGETLVKPRQFRIRMISAAIWMTILAANFYAVTALWPDARYLPTGALTPESKQQARLFIQVVGGSFSLVFIGLFFFLVDMRQTARERQAMEQQRQREFATITRAAQNREDSSPFD
jgi:hypothetical protein